MDEPDEDGNVMDESAGRRGTTGSRTSKKTASAPRAIDRLNDGEAPSEDNLLGEVGPGVSAEDHAHMQSLCRQGAVPNTTLRQRQRNRLTPGSHYGVPNSLKRALRLGYIHPCLPPPRGFIWKPYAGGSWGLVGKGG